MYCFCVNRISSQWTKSKKSSPIQSPVRAINSTPVRQERPTKEQPDRDQLHQNRKNNARLHLQEGHPNQRCHSSRWFILFSIFYFSIVTLNIQILRSRGKFGGIFTFILTSYKSKCCVIFSFCFPLHTLKYKMFW